MTAMGTRSARLLLPALCVTLLAAGCGSKDSGPDPAPTADGLAQGLTSGDLSGVVFSGMARRGPIGSTTRRSPAWAA